MKSRSISMSSFPIGFALFLMVGSLTATDAAAALVQLSSNSGEVRDLVQHATTTNTLFAATQGGGVYKSTDGGSNWFRLTGLIEPYVWRLAGDPTNGQVLYAATNRGLFKTTDGGTNWSQKTFDNVRAVAINPFNASTILIGVPGAGIFRSVNGGSTFSVINTGLDSLDVTAIAFNPVTSGVVYVGLKPNLVGNLGGVFKSTNGGANWSNWNNPNGAGALGNAYVTALAVEDDGTVHVGTYNPFSGSGKVYKQTGAGGWNVGFELFGVETLVTDKNAVNKLWAGTRAFGPRVTVNNGDNWNQANGSSLDVYTGVYSILTFAGNASKILAGVKGRGLYLTTNSGSTWNKSSGGLTADRANALVADPGNSDTLYMGLEGGGVIRSTNGGTSWSDFNTGLEIPFAERYLSVSFLGIGTSSIYATVWGRGLFKWDGSSWQPVSESRLPALGVRPTGLVVHPTDDRIVYYSLFDIGQGVYRRNTNGTWSNVLLGPFPGGGGASKVVLSPTLNGSVAGTRAYGLWFDDLPFRSTNGGSNWTQVSATHKGFIRLAFFAIGENPLNANNVLASTNKGLFQSSDGGSNWTAVNVSGALGSSVLTGLVFSPTVNNRVWAVDRGGGYYCSNDGGTSWSAKADPLLGSVIIDLKVINGALFLVTDGSGILKDPAPTCL